MIGSKKEATEIARTAAEIMLDDALEERAFSRAKKSLTYKKSLQDGYQEFELVINFRRGGTAGRIYPWVAVVFPPLAEIVRGLVENVDQVGGFPDLVLRQPLDTVAPADVHERWLFSSSQDALASAERTREFFLRWGLPFLSHYESPASLCVAYEQNDTRAARPDHSYLFVAAAYLYEGAPDRARHVLDKQFTSPGLRTRFAGAFERVDDILGGRC